MEMIQQPMNTFWHFTTDLARGAKRHRTLTTSMGRFLQTAWHSRASQAHSWAYEVSRTRLQSHVGSVRLQWKTVQKRLQIQLHLGRTFAQLSVLSICHSNIQRSPGFMLCRAPASFEGYSFKSLMSYWSVFVCISILVLTTTTSTPSTALFFVERHRNDFAANR